MCGSLRELTPRDWKLAATFGRQSAALGISGPGKPGCEFAPNLLTAKSQIFAVLHKISSGFFGWPLPNTEAYLYDSTSGLESR
jgi:hypothetical protein